MIDRDRYSRLLAIPDYPVEWVEKALILVGGVGALGNEVVKNLCLLGFRHIFLADMDRVEPSNLTRSVLFRSEDCGRPKVEAAARGGKRINEETRFYCHDGDIADIGLGVFRRVNMLFSDFDDLYPRYYLNSVATRLGMIWVDAYLGLKPYGGGVLVLNGADPEMPCYVCHTGVRTYKETYNFIQDREGCQVKERKRSAQGFIPTTPTTCSAVAAFQVQAGLQSLITGASHENPWISYMFHLDLAWPRAHLEKPVKRKNCPFHPPADRICENTVKTFHDWCSDKVTLREIFKAAREIFSIPPDHEIYVQPPQQMILLKTCRDCGKDIHVFQPVIRLVREERKGIPFRCPHCGSTATRNHPIFGVASLWEESGFPFIDMTLEQLGGRRFDILTLLEDDGETQRYYYMEVTGDIEKVLPGWKD